MYKKGIFFRFLNQKGQALLIIVLVMVVALTVGLSVASRTIINLRNSSDQISSQQALSAAEAGIARAIETNSANTASNLPGNSSYTTSVVSVSGTAPFLINGGNLVPKDDAVYVWITPYTANQNNLYSTMWTGSLTLYWGKSGQDCTVSSNMPSAIEVSVVNGPKTTPTLSRYAFDPCSARANVNHFDFSSVNSGSPTTIKGKTLTYKTTISVTNGLLIRINPVYATAFIGASGAPAAGNPALPDQGAVITSTGTSNSSTTRKVTVFQGFPEIPAELFPYSLFSP